MTTVALKWIDAQQRRPDADTSVLCWLSDGEWFSGWWDEAAGRWFDCATGAALEDVTHWTEVEGPA